MITLTYDAISRLERVDGGDAFVRYGYDDLSRVVEVENEHQLLSFAYDDEDRLTQTTSAPIAFGAHPTLTFDYAYSPGGRVTQVGTPEGPIDFTYDHRGRPASVTDPRIGTTTYAFDADDRLASVLRDNGLQTTYAYTTAGRVERITVLDNGSTVDESLFQYDLRGQVTSVSDAFGQHDYGYDTAGQLTSADHPVASGLDSESYTYDLLGNRTEWDGHPPAAVAYDTEGRLIQDADNSYAFDAEGNLTEHVDLGSAHLTEYHWNSFGELVRIVHPDGTESTFAYDGLGRRVEAVDRGTPTRFGWDGGVLRMQFDDNNQLTRWIGTGAFAEPLAEYDAASGLVEDVLTDKMGSTTGTWDGTGVTRSPRDSFGNLPGNAAPTDFQHHALTCVPAHADRDVGAVPRSRSLRLSAS